MSVSFSFDPIQQSYKARRAMPPLLFMGHSAGRMEAFTRVRRVVTLQ